MPTGKALIREIRDAHPEGDHISLWWLGQMGLAIKCRDTALLIDACLEPRGDRLVPPAFTPEEAAGCFDAVLGTHDHDDHIDCWAWERLAKADSRTVFIGAAAHRESVCARTGIDPGRYLGADEGITLKVGNLTIDAIAAAHEFIEKDSSGRNLHLSYIIDNRLFHAGDTLVYDGQRAKLRGFGPFKAMLLPINGRDAERYRRNCIGNMTFQEAVDLAGDLKPEYAIPGHYDLFAGNTANPEDFREYLNAKYPDVGCLVPNRFTMFTV